MSHDQGMTNPQGSTEDGDSEQQSQSGANYWGLVIGHSIGSLPIPVE
jgi:hypothetical protein